MTCDNGVCPSVLLYLEQFKVEDQGAVGRDIATGCLSIAVLGRNEHLHAPADSRGYILVGQNQEVGMVLNSRKCFMRLFELMEAARSRGEDIWVTVRSYNGWTYG